MAHGAIVSKSGPPTKTNICNASRVRLRRRNQTKGDLPLALQNIYGPPFTWAANKLEGKWKVRTTKNHERTYVTLFSLKTAIIRGY